ncbi:hypothetical protein AB0O07_21460 [Streptomyces sp. NPDC093085]|uniref:hypothetical protein n=1 Tax=Streptomyces sp. NPDC093085 TaxID=3155068 RepID=UPI00343FC00B
MVWVAGVGLLVGILAIGMGAVTLRTGWVPPTVRRRGVRTRLHGAGVALTGTSLVLQGLLALRVLPAVPWEAGFYGGNALLIGGLVLIVLSRFLSRRRDPDRTAPSEA